MTVYRPLVLIGNTVSQLADADELTAAKNLNLLDIGGSTPEAVALRVGSQWQEMTWAAFLTLIGSVSSPYAVTVNGDAVKVNGILVEVT